VNDGRRNLSDTLRDAAADLRAAGVPDAMTDARILASAALRMSREDMLREPEREIDPGGLARLDAMVRRRAGREPNSAVCRFGSDPRRSTRAPIAKQ
jgi:release factor glutamine methyltransferase